MLKNITFFLAVLGAAPALAQEASTPKLGPNAIPITADTAYLRGNPAPDYWAFAPFVKPQFTSSACSIASVTAALNGLAGLPPGAQDQVMTQPDLLALVGDADWTALSAEDGAGVRFDQLASFTKKALAARQMSGYRVETFRPKADDPATAAEMRKLLTANEATADDALLVYFNQGVVTGDWDGPHISVIGAYDAQKDRVLILEVDQAWYIPYWTPANALLAAMLKPAPEDQKPLNGETGGLVHIVKPAA